MVHRTFRTCPLREEPKRKGSSMQIHACPSYLNAVRPMRVFGPRVLSIVALCSACVSFSAAQILAAEQVVEMHDNFFQPSTLTIPQGDSVRWVNQGTSPHTTTASG